MGGESSGLLRSSEERMSGGITVDASDEVSANTLDGSRTDMSSDEDDYLFDEDGYDPFEDEEDEEPDPEEQIETFGYVGNPATLAPKSELEPTVPATPREKTDELFKNMAPYKRYLLAILDHCLTPRDIDDIEVFIEEMQTNRRVVYTAINYCRMLSDVEALAKVTEDGQPYRKEQVEPEEYEDEDGNVYLKPGTPPPAFWCTTEFGRKVLEDDNPLDVLKGIFQEHARYESVFRRILELCDAEDGSSINDIKSQINGDPILENPKKTAQFFMDYLDRNGAIVWDQNWKTTDIGKQALELLAV